MNYYNAFKDLCNVLRESTAYRPDTHHVAVPLSVLWVQQKHCFEGGKLGR
jgi:hypothetical protein